MIVQRLMVVCYVLLVVVDQFVVSQSLNDSNAQPLVSNIQNHRQHFDERETLEKKDDKVFNIDPDVVTNSHRPQFYGVAQENQEYVNRDTLDRIDISKPEEHYEIDDNESLDEAFDETIDETDNIALDEEEEYKPSHHLRNKQIHLKNIIVKLLERSDQKRKFAEVIPILKVLTPAQRLVMASLVSKQLLADSKNPPLTLPQVKAMFGNNANITSDLMLPIMLDIANIFHSAKDHYRAQELKMAPQAQQLRRSFSDGDDDDIESMMADHFRISEEAEKLIAPDVPEAKGMKIAAKIPAIIKNSNVKVGSNLKVGVGNEEDEQDDDDDLEAVEDNDNVEVIKGNVTVPKPEQLTVVYPVNQTKLVGNGNASEDLPIAEKLRALNRFIDRNGNLIAVRRPVWDQEALKSVLGQGPANRQTINDILMAQRRRTQLPNRNTLIEMARHKCDLFTNSLCLKSVDYPSDAITASIRRNQGAMNALLADFPEISADSAIDGISSKQENKYTPEYYINNINRREDGQMPAGASGFMCPSTVKYARPQKARATSGQWKFIVNTGEHTQTLRLEKCLKPREPCTYLTDNFKSKCVQVYNYHRLLTWDQQNGLHMDIFKVPTCCSCHIEGYSVAFPPHISKPSESPLEHFPGEDLHDSDVNPFEEVQPSIRHSTHTNFPAPIDAYSTLGETHNLIPGSSFQNPAFTEDNPAFHDFKQFQFPGNQFESIGPNFHTDIFQNQASNVRNVKKPPRMPTNSVGLPSFLEPPSKPVVPIHNSFIKPDFPTKNKPFGNPHFKRGVQGAQNPTTPKRPGRRPLRKKNSNVAEDQMVGATNIHENPTVINMNTFEDINQAADKYERTSTIRSTTAIHRATSTIRPEVSTSKITIKNVSPTTERYRVKYKTTARPTTTSKETPLNRRVNYNYHPIIDFFEESSKKDQAADRMDSGTVYFASGEDDWRPMANPIAMPLKGTPSETSSG